MVAIWRQDQKAPSTIIGSLLEPVARQVQMGSSAPLMKNRNLLILEIHLLYALRIRTITMIMSWPSSLLNTMPFR